LSGTILSLIRRNTRVAKRHIRYSSEAKAKITEAVAAARKTGTWKDAHAAAQKVGYKGRLDALMQFIAKKGAPKKRLGRPAKVKVPTPAVAPALDPVAAQYLVGAIDKAVAELQKLRKQYAK
jgi:hypothetical protein